MITSNLDFGGCEQKKENVTDYFHFLRKENKQSHYDAVNCKKSRKGNKSK